ncbi:hypothetical protein BGZ65_006659 [Modicella reniformis]|uniref:Adhesin domain-containing protein n=1 Tax=Modicella reniformis TaxID=1440133 RepID=A0A9P6MLD0_9FUNG|nr:hypothetical protein BGZ65_006659 [Modicella reniformis]
MGLFNEPLVSVNCDNEDLQISTELSRNVVFSVVGLAKGEFIILSGNVDMIHIKTCIQAKERMKNTTTLEAIQDGNRYIFTIRTSLEEKHEKGVVFTVFVTIPRTLESLESFMIEGTNVEVSIGNLSQTFIKNLTVSKGKGNVTVDDFYGENVTITNAASGRIKGKYRVARFTAHTQSGKISSNVHLLNAIDEEPAPKVICSTKNSHVNLYVNGKDLFGPFTVEAKTQNATLNTMINLASKCHKLRGNFINFGGPIKLNLSKNYRGRIETRTHYGKIHMNEPEFFKLDGAILTKPSLSDLNRSSINCTQLQTNQVQPSESTSTLSSDQSNEMSSWALSHSTGMSLEEEQHPHRSDTHLDHLTQSSRPGSVIDSASSSRARSTKGSFSVIRSLSVGSRSRKERISSNTQEIIGTIGDGPGLLMAKNSSGDITVELT